MPRRIVDRDVKIPNGVGKRLQHRDDELDLDLRLGHMRRQQALGHLVTGGPRVAVPLPMPGSRHVVVKVWGASPGTTGRHLRYLAHAKGTDGTDTTLFHADGYTTQAQPFIQQARHDPHQYRLVMSMPDVAGLSLTHFVQAWMRQVSRDLHHPVDYLAAIHWDTAHPHAHVVLRGTSQHGDALWLPRRYLTHGLRYRAMAMATAWLGPVAAAERSAQAQVVQALNVAMTEQRRDAKKEDAMDDQDQDRLPRELDPQPHVPESPYGSAPTILQRLQALLEQVQRERDQERDHGMGM